ncbi:hypothetical protein WME89_41415 [Sorangium sp. So ce321]|uniref:hypothetical protein n=1 Tax=Sorangium sp. So ce321 TaxID=3133300 RepID=UPI003F616C4C
MADALGLVATQAPEIPTTFRLHAPDARDDLGLWMGSPALFAGSFQRDKIVDWMKLRAEGPPGLPAGVTVRPPRRTVFDWRDGLPGEAPTLVTPGGAAIVIEHEGGAAIDIHALTRWIDSFPEGTWLVGMSAAAVEVRADAPATEDAVRSALSLFALVSVAPGGAAE